MKLIKILLLLVTVVAVILTAFILKTMYDAGEFRDLKYHTPGACRLVEGVYSSEDIVVDRENGRAYISARKEGRRQGTDQSPARGAVFAFDLEDPAAMPVDISVGLKMDFNPLGMGLYISPQGERRLFVVNHRPDGAFVEILRLGIGGLESVRSVSGKLMNSPNDVLPVGPEQFYVSNDHGSTSRLGRTLEEYLQLARSNVVYFNGNNFSLAVQGLAYANGLGLSPDGKTLYVAETVGRAVRVYDRDPNSGALTQRRVVDADSGVDNIDVDPRGHLWIGAHPQLLTFVAYAGDPSKTSPSQVLEIIPGAGDFTVREVYLGDGKELSGSSVAVKYKDRLLIGSVFDPRFLICPLPEPGPDKQVTK